MIKIALDEKCKGCPLNDKDMFCQDINGKHYCWATTTNFDIDSERDKDEPIKKTKAKAINDPFLEGICRNLEQV